MTSTYFVFSLKMSAWWGANGAWTSDLKAAKEYSREAAIDFCKARYSRAQDEIQAVPVAADDIEAVKAK